MNSQRMMEAYIEDCKEDPDLQSFNDKCRAGFEAVMRTSGEGDGVGQLKDVVSVVCDMNRNITDRFLTYQDEIVKSVAGEEEFDKLVLLYFDTTSGMLDFCIKLETFVGSARDRHSYIAHVIEENLAGNIGSKNRLQQIAEKLGNLKGEIVSGSGSSAPGLFGSIIALKTKFEAMFEALKRCHNKLQEKLEANRSMKKVTNWVLIGTIVGVGVLLAVTIVAACPGLAAFAGTKVIGTVVTMAVANPNTVIGTVVALNTSIAVLEALNHWASHLFDRIEENMKNQQAIVNEMRVKAHVANKDLGDIRYFIERLLIQIDSIVELAMDHPDDDSFVTTEIKKKLGTFLARIEELDEEQKRCAEEIRKARDDVLVKLTRNVDMVNKGKQA